MNPEDGVRIDFNNVTRYEGNKNPDFLIEVSGEFLTKKIRKYIDSPENYMSPFIKNGVSRMGMDCVDGFKSTALGFLSSINTDWPIVRRINELWLNQNHKYLCNELYKIVDKTYHPTDTLGLLSAVHAVNRAFISPISEKYFYENADFIFKQIKNIQNQEHKQLFDLAKHFKNHLNNYEEKIFLITNKFIEKFPMLIPIVGLEYYKNQDYKAIAMKKMGLTTVDFEDVKDFYIDTFEDLGDIFDLIVAYENLIVRSNFKLMNPNIDKPIKTLDDYSKMKKKGRKLEFINSLEVFNELFISKVDNRLRNAIGHRSYKYDIDTQKLTYSPSGKMDQGALENLYLAEFTYECLQLFRTCLAIGELIYQTRKYICVIEGSYERTTFNEYHHDPSIQSNNVTDSFKRNKDIFKKKKRTKNMQKKSRKINRK
ncbi:metal-binding protein [Bacillus toyonensis]|nr:metal-binding protein [Bacillus toyonensis]PDY86328.1 metal-binding protein [Bacillus toyonensis]